MALLQHNLSVDHSGSFRCIVLRSVSSPKKVKGKNANMNPNYILI